MSVIEHGCCGMDCPPRGSRPRLFIVTFRQVCKMPKFHWCISDKIKFLTDTLSDFPGFPGFVEWNRRNVVQNTEKLLEIDRENQVFSNKLPAQLRKNANHGRNTSGFLTRLCAIHFFHRKAWIGRVRLTTFLSFVMCNRVFFIKSSICGSSLNNSSICLFLYRKVRSLLN